jgi:hypothetical protein
VCSDASSGSRRTNFEARSRMTTALFQRTLVVSFDLSGAAVDCGGRWVMIGAGAVRNKVLRSDDKRNKRGRN